MMFVMGALTLAVCVRALSDAYLGDPVNVIFSLRYAARRILPLLALEIVAVIGQFLGFVLLINPGIWLYAAWSVRLPVLMIEEVGPLSALSRSRELVRGRWGATAVVLLFSGALVAVGGGLVSTAISTSVVVSAHPSVLFAVAVTAAASTVVGVVLQPFSAAVITVLYYDLKIRREQDDQAEPRPRRGSTNTSADLWPSAAGHANSSAWRSTAVTGASLLAPGTDDCRLGLSIGAT